MSKIMHPDRAPPDEREAANEKFRTLKESYEILMNRVKRIEYDAAGTMLVDDSQESYFIVTDQQMKECMETYAGSERERQDIRNLYIEGGGEIGYVVKNLPFALATDESRIANVVDGTNQFLPIFSLL